MWPFSFQPPHIYSLCCWRQLQLFKLFLWRHGSLLVWLTYKIFMYVLKNTFAQFLNRNFIDNTVSQYQKIGHSWLWSLLTLLFVLIWPGYNRCCPFFRTIPPFCVSFDLVTYLLRKFLWLTFLDHFYRKMWAYWKTHQNCSPQQNYISQCKF